jgi:hypothetical protein
LILCIFDLTIYIHNNRELIEMKIKQFITKIKKKPIIPITNNSGNSDNLNSLENSDNSENKNLKQNLIEEEDEYTTRVIV